ncbi:MULTISPECIES: hypothetical protein [Streptomyces]|uniref:Lipoprotein n=2 Tax=Streptomyces TaxID=1883 RepID=A0A100Y0V6_9ACTN|nr:MULTISPECIES: hypothetical protein [Streptomyces]KUH35641.1 hypothetical protein ATE80_28085 [Streptomyces kanasensis]UUS35082.1 hypothetical protein NRO40_30170 [Streptomyces changanensis]
MSRTRGTWNTRGMWAGGAALAAVLALSACSLLGTGETGSEVPVKGGAGASAAASVSPTPSYTTPSDWDEPERWAALPPGQRTDERGSQVGYPHTAEGAVAMMAAANTMTVEGGKSSVDEQLRIYHSYFSTDDQSAEGTEAVERQATDTDTMLARQAGVRAGQPLPSGAYTRSHIVGYKIIKESGDEVSAWLLGRVVQKTGEIEKENGFFTRTLAGAQWRGGDWKLTTTATERAQRDAQIEGKPPMAAPGDIMFNRAEWTAIREAS